MRICYAFFFCLRIWNQCKILHLLVPILTYLKKSFQLYFLKNNKWSILLNSMVLSRSGEGAISSKMPCTASNLPQNLRCSLSAFFYIGYILFDYSFRFGNEIPFLKLVNRADCAKWNTIMKAYLQWILKGLKFQNVLLPDILSYISLPTNDHCRLLLKSEICIEKANT